jgi:hypothetical protein
MGSLVRTSVSRGSAVPAVALLAAATVALADCSGSSSGTPKAGSPGNSARPASSTSSAPESTAPSPPQPAATEINPPGDIPDNQVFVTYRPAGAKFTVKVPEGWARSSPSGAVIFTDKLNSITVESGPAARKPTIASVQGSELPTVERQGGNYKPGKVTVIRRKAGPAVLATYLQDSQPDTVTNKVVRDAVERYSFWSNGTEAVLTLSGPKGADNVDPWRIVSDSLRWH